MDAIQTIIAAYDAWIVATNDATRAELALNAMSAYILSDDDRIRMYTERQDAAALARRRESETRRTLDIAIADARRVVEHG
jgi:hypothetical protein